MKFSSLVLFTSLALAAPKSEPRQTTVVGTISNVVNTLQTAVQQNLDAIRKTITARLRAPVITTLCQNPLSSPSRTMSLPRSRPP
jgi:hypothetical protein